MEDRKRTIHALILFVVLTFALSTPFMAWVIREGRMSAGGGLAAIGGMWSPGVAALITAAVFRLRLKDFGWGWGKTRYQLWSIAVPLLYVLCAYTFVWVTGLGRFIPDKFSSQILKRLIWFAPGLILALGEEIGWSGFFVPQLARVTSFTKTSLIRGLVWAVWHFPMIIAGVYANDTPILFNLISFTVLLTGISFGFAWLRLKSGSLWTGMFFHAWHNMFIQSIFTPATADTGLTKYFVDEFGAAVAIAGIITGIIFWKKRAALR